MAGKQIRFMIILGVTIFAGVLLLGMAAGCSSKSNSNPYGPGGGGGGSGGPGANEVWIQNFAFNPASMTVAMGATVTWTNKDATAHTVTGSGWGSGNLGSGATFSHTFSTAGSYPYHCSIHPSMTATITVQ